MKSIELPEGKGLWKIGMAAFEGCTGLSDIWISAAAAAISDAAGSYEETLQRNTGILFLRNL